jgi:hypothetical protein
MQLTSSTIESSRHVIYDFYHVSMCFCDLIEKFLSSGESGGWK